MNRDYNFIEDRDTWSFLNSANIEVVIKYKGNLTNPKYVIEAKRGGRQVLYYDEGTYSAIFEGNTIEEAFNDMILTLSGKCLICDGKDFGAFPIIIDASLKKKKI